MEEKVKKPRRQRVPVKPWNVLVKVKGRTLYGDSITDRGVELVLSAGQRRFHVSKAHHPIIEVNDRTFQAPLRAAFPTPTGQVAPAFTPVEATPVVSGGIAELARRKALRREQLGEAVVRNEEIAAMSQLPPALKGAPEDEE
jgi:hypothetical protein